MNFDALSEKRFVAWKAAPGSCPRWTRRDWILRACPHRKECRCGCLDYRERRHRLHAETGLNDSAANRTSG